MAVMTKEKKRQKKGFFNFWGGNSDDSSSEEEAPQLPPKQQPKPQQQQKIDYRINMQGMTENEKNEIKLMRELTKTYLQIVRKSVEDFVPKAIIHFLVNQTMKNLQNELIKDLYHPDRIDELMCESEAVKTKRNMLKRNMDALQSAATALEAIAISNIE